MSVYFLRERGTDWVKVGFSQSPNQRRKQLKTGNPRELEIVAVAPGGLPEEKRIQKLLAHHRSPHSGEWFSAGPALDLAKELGAEFYATPEPYTPTLGAPTSESFLTADLGKLTARRREGPQTPAPVDMSQAHELLRTPPKPRLPRF